MVVLFTKEGEGTVLLEATRKVNWRDHSVGAHTTNWQMCWFDILPPGTSVTLEVE